MPSSHLILCSPLLLLPPIPPSIRVFSNELTLPMRWPKYRSFSFSIIPSKEIPGLISFRWTGWISLQSKGLSRVFSNTTVQKHLRHSAFFIVQLSHPYMTTGKTIGEKPKNVSKYCQISLGGKIIIFWISLIYSILPFSSPPSKSFSISLTGVKTRSKLHFWISIYSLYHLICSSISHVFCRLKVSSKVLITGKFNLLHYIKHMYYKMYYTTLNHI